MTPPSVLLNCVSLSTSSSMTSLLTTTNGWHGMKLAAAVALLLGNLQKNLHCLQIS
jgi:hypothetical protein